MGEKGRFVQLSGLENKSVPFSEAFLRLLEMEGRCLALDAFKAAAPEVQPDAVV